MKKLIPALMVAAFAATIFASTTSATTTATATVRPAALAPVNFLSFLNRTVNYNTIQLGHLSDWQIDLQYYDIPSAAIDSHAARNKARSEYSWILGHYPNQSCFTRFYAAYKSMVHYEDLAFSNLYLWHVTNANVYYNRGMAYLRTANAKIKSTTAIMNATFC